MKLLPVSRLEKLEEIVDMIPGALEKLKSMKAEQKKVNTIRSGAMRLASELQGGGIRQGSFYPPTKTHLKRYDQLVGLWEEYQESNE